jgi:hypothetical protein
MPRFAQSELQRSSLEGGHPELVDHKLVFCRGEVGHKLESLGAARNHGFTASGASTRCHAMALGVWKGPIQ